MLQVTKHYSQRRFRHWTLSDGTEVSAHCENGEVVWTIERAQWSDKRSDKTITVDARPRSLRRAILRSLRGHWHAIHRYHNSSQGARARVEFHNLLAATDRDRLESGDRFMTGCAIADNGETWTSWEYHTGLSAAEVEEMCDPDSQYGGSYGGPGRAFNNPSWARKISDSEVLITVTGGLDI